MKTSYHTNLGFPVHLDLSNQLKAAFPTLPRPVLNERLYQAFYQISLLGPDHECYGFFETELDEPRGMLPDDPVGTIVIRIDYDPKFYQAQIGEEPFNESDALMQDMSVMLVNPNHPEMFPHNCGIDHFRVAIKVDEDSVVEHTYWPTHYNFM